MSWLPNDPDKPADQTPAEPPEGPNLPPGWGFLAEPGWPRALIFSLLLAVAIGVVPSRFFGEVGLGTAEQLLVALCVVGAGVAAGVWVTERTRRFCGGRGLSASIAASHTVLIGALFSLPLWAVVLFLLPTAVLLAAGILSAVCYLFVLTQVYAVAFDVTPRRAFRGVALSHLPVLLAVVLLGAAGLVML